MKLLVISLSVLVISIQINGFPTIIGSSNENVDQISGHYQGDILLTPDQSKALRGTSRTGLRDIIYRWPNRTIPYSIDAVFNENEVDLIETGIQRIIDATCLNIIQRTDEVNYVRIIVSFKICFLYKKNKKIKFPFQGEPAGCFSMIGYLGFGAHPLNLERNGCVTNGIIIHEFIHAIGFLHMQSSYQRDDYVTINWENIQSDVAFNFDKYPEEDTTMFGLPYDLGSLMHYDRYAFSSNGNETITPHVCSIIFFYELSFNFNFFL